MGQLSTERQTTSDPYFLTVIVTSAGLAEFRALVLMGGLGRLLAFQELPHFLKHLRWMGIVVILALQDEEMFGLVRRLIKFFGQPKGNQIIGSSMGYKNRPLASLDLGQVVKTVPHDPSNRQPGINALSDVGHGSKGFSQDECSVRPTTRQVDRDASTHRTAINQSLVGRNPFRLRQPIVSGIGGRIATVFAGFARALSIAGVIENQDRQVKIFVPARNRVSPKTEITGIAMTIKQCFCLMISSVVSTIFHRTPPGMQEGAVCCVKLNILYCQVIASGINPLLAGGSGVV